MKIVRVEAWPVRLPLAEPYTIAYETVGEAVNVILRLETDRGPSGFGCAAPDLEVTGEDGESVQRVLAEIVERVLTIEVRPALYDTAVARLARLHYTNIECRCADGQAGWAEQAPYDAILVTAAPPHEVPPALLDQLAEGGRLVVPVGERDQQLLRIERRGGNFSSERVTGVRFVPLVSAESLES